MVFDKFRDKLNELGLGGQERELVYPIESNIIDGASKDVNLSKSDIKKVIVASDHVLKTLLYPRLIEISKNGSPDEHDVGERPFSYVIEETEHGLVVGGASNVIVTLSDVLNLTETETKALKSAHRIAAVENGFEEHTMMDDVMVIPKPSEDEEEPEEESTPSINDTIEKEHRKRTQKERERRRKRREEKEKRPKEADETDEGEERDSEEKEEVEAEVEEDVGRGDVEEEEETEDEKPEVESEEKTITQDEEKERDRREQEAKETSPESSEEAEESERDKRRKRDILETTREDSLTEKDNVGDTIDKMLDEMSQDSRSRSESDEETDEQEDDQPKVYSEIQEDEEEEGPFEVVKDENGYRSRIPQGVYSQIANLRPTDEVRIGLDVRVRDGEMEFIATSITEGSMEAILQGEWVWIPDIIGGAMRLEDTMIDWVIEDGEIIGKIEYSFETADKGGITNKTKVPVQSYGDTIESYLPSGLTRALHLEDGDDVLLFFEVSESGNINLVVRKNGGEHPHSTSVEDKGTATTQIRLSIPEEVSQILGLESKSIRWGVRERDGETELVGEIVER